MSTGVAAMSRALLATLVCDSPAMKKYLVETLADDPEPEQPEPVAAGDRARTNGTRSRMNSGCWRHPAPPRGGAPATESTP